MKRAVLILLLILFSLPARAELPRIGVLWYNGNDTFISGMAADIRARAEGRAALAVKDAGNDQNTQFEQLNDLLRDKTDALIINPVDRTAAMYIVSICKQKNVPVVFINREPFKDDLLLYEKAYYVGAQPSRQGEMCGELLAEYFLSHPECDKNGDGRIQFVLIKGENGHQDAEKRSISAIEALAAAGLRPEKLGEESGGWEKRRGQQIMASFLSLLGDRIEGVVSNNDDMALGAIDVLKAAGYFGDGPFMPVVSVDATPPALDALTEGTLLGTVLNDAARQSGAALELALLLAKGETPADALVSPDAEGAPAADALLFSDGRFIWIPGRKITGQGGGK